MYFIIEHSPEQNYDCKIIRHINLRNPALTVLEEVCVEYINIEAGRNQSENFKILETKTINEISQNVPEKDGYYVYRLTEDLDRLYVYRKSTNIQRGYIMTSLDVVWKCVKVFQLYNYENFNIQMHNMDKLTQPRFVIKAGNDERVDKFKTVLNELMKNTRFVLINN